MCERACAWTVPGAPRGAQREDGKTITTKRQRRALPEQQRQAGPAAFPRQRCRWLSQKPFTGNHKTEGSQAPWLSHRHRAVTQVDWAASARRRERTRRQNSSLPVLRRDCLGSALRLPAGKAAGDTGAGSRKHLRAEPRLCPLPAQIRQALQAGALCPLLAPGRFLPPPSPRPAAPALPAHPAGTGTAATSGSLRPGSPSGCGAGCDPG